MNIALLVVITVGVVLFALFSRYRTKNAGQTKTHEKDTVDTSVDTLIEDSFFERVRLGETRLPFLKIDNQFDLLFIKSLFQSEQIPYYIAFEHISKVRPGMMIGDLGNYSLLYILENDYDDAVEVVHMYLENKINDSAEKDETGKQVIEIVFANWKVPSAQDIDGFRILYKTNEEAISFRQKIEKIIDQKNETS